jgi:ribose transport system substrate-binding protein
MFKSKLLATALTAAAFMGLAALPLAASGAARADEPTIGLAVANLQANFFNQIKQSVEAEAKLKGVKVVVVDAHGDSATQVNEIQDLITRGVKALIYIPAGATAGI